MLRRWTPSDGRPSGRGEERWIFPFQENADAMFNSSLLFELGVIREEADGVLARVPPATYRVCRGFAAEEIHRLFCSDRQEYVPSTSLIREFIGGSSFTLLSSASTLKGIRGVVGMPCPSASTSDGCELSLMMLKVKRALSGSTILIWRCSARRARWGRSVRESTTDPAATSALRRHGVVHLRLPCLWRRRDGCGIP